jgi:hypothetical protein
MSGRPLVVLGGWLGCQRRSLRRYETLYTSLGFDVLLYILPPRLVVDAALRSRQMIRVPEQWPAQLLPPDVVVEPEIMQELVWQVLGRMHNQRSSVFLYHAFSNGGCFLWESMRRILDHSDDEACQQPTRDILKSLLLRMKGVLFDSCPAWFAGSDTPGVRGALQYCSPREKLDVLMRYGPGVLFYDGKAAMEQQTHRCHDFFRYLQENSLDIPQQYIYGKDDPLSDYEKIEELFRKRRSTQKSPVLHQVWDTSAHCAHLRTHPDEYKQTVEFFTQISLLRSKL